MEKLDKKKTILMGILLLIAVVLIFVYVNYFRTFTVTFNVRIGAGIQAQEVRVGDTVEKPDDPTADGYTFIGWYVDGQEYDFSAPVENDIEIIAEWEENE